MSAAEAAAHATVPVVPAVPVPVVPALPVPVVPAVPVLPVVPALPVLPPSVVLELLLQPTDMSPAEARLKIPTNARFLNSVIIILRVRGKLLRRTGPPQMRR